MKVEPKAVPNFFIATKQAAQYRCTKRTILNGRSKAARKPGPVVVTRPTE